MWRRSTPESNRVVQEEHGGESERVWILSECVLEAQEELRAREEQLALVQSMLRLTEAELAAEKRRTAQLSARVAELDDALLTANHLATTALDQSEEVLRKTRAGGGTAVSSAEEGGGGASGGDVAGSVWESVLLSPVSTESLEDNFGLTPTRRKGAAAAIAAGLTVRCTTANAGSPLSQPPPASQGDTSRGAGSAAGGRGDSGGPDTPRSSGSRTVLLEPKRSSAIGIVLRSWRVSLPALRDAAATLDAAVLPADRIEVLLGTAGSPCALPRPGEVRLVRQWLESRGVALDDTHAVEASLGEAEAFFAIVGGVPRLAPRLRLLLAEQSYLPRAAQLSSQLRVCSEAAAEVMGSGTLRRLLGTLLGVGNTLNAATFRGGAKGFEVGSLPKLLAGGRPQSRGGIIGYLAAHTPSLPGDLEEEMPSLPGATRLCLAELALELRELQASIDTVEEDLTQALREAPLHDEGTGSHDHIFVARARGFLSAARPRRRALEAQLPEAEAGLDGVSRYLAAEAEGEWPASVTLEAPSAPVLRDGSSDQAGRALDAAPADGGPPSESAEQVGRGSTDYGGGDEYF
ncbi:hypothetical protein EMIHUDRAFT_228447 [Emiliania huxleyi CCMP1516]|uniref:FH2 domain-containing protein n=2 Tax=Emiliania huxleyi TaxID=2903 RepID=A0A0D3KFX9_EMIH1|nr:hypothetical protein EMIHUDRAFT_228447 [Emiliania huxleyi CCMP1516]EOD34664.1 hypothetical protein EMIHUDRAFT_228447 [Emiliania huxleyi CCMP1516]|eukprot:XP_005787093.1 hypothetical protein EMIHUDRAFT_228447 [Emiliania huxleyi CCMP1516]